MSVNCFTFASMQEHMPKIPYLAYAISALSAICAPTSSLALSCFDSLRLGPALEQPDAYLVATNKGILRLDRATKQADKDWIQVGDNNVQQLRDYGDGYLASVNDGCGNSLTTNPCSIYRISYGLDTIKRIASTPVAHREASLLYAHLDSVFVSLVNGGLYVSYDFMKSWSFVREHVEGCSISPLTSGYAEAGGQIYLANWSGLFTYKPFEESANAVFCNAPGHFSGFAAIYGDSLIVSDSGYDYRIAKIGENKWTKYPLPAEYRPPTISCDMEIFSTYMVFQSQPEGCGVEKAITISIYDLKARKIAKVIKDSEWGVPINFTATGKTLFVNRGPGGIAVYDADLKETVFPYPDCAPTGVFPQRAEIKVRADRKRIRSVDGRERSRGLRLNGFWETAFK